MTYLPAYTNKQLGNYIAGQEVLCSFLKSQQVNGFLTRGK